MTRCAASQGFTIMEVMVAIMILAVSVVSIFGAQFAAVATTEYAKHITEAVNLAECRMNEIELEVLTEDGFKLGNVESSGDCCEAMEDEKIGDYECSWEIKVVELPNLGEALLSGEDGGMGLLGGMDLGTSSLDENEPADDLGIMGAVETFAPMLSDILAEGVRRVTVTVKWKQGNREPEYTLSQFIVHPTEGSLGLLNDAMTAEDALSGETGDDATGGGGATGGGSADDARQRMMNLFGGGGK